MTVPESISSLFLNISLMNLLTTFVIWGVVGHINVANFLSSDKSWKRGKISDNLLNVALRVFLNLLHSIIKCCSVSIDRNSPLSFVLVGWQYAQTRWLYGITGRDLRSSSVASECALIRMRVSDDLWFLFLTSLTYGSDVKDDLNCLYTLSLLWSRLSVLLGLNSFIFSLSY